jgi:hydroxyacylglutathione hydrolase
VEPDNTDLQAYSSHCQQLRTQGKPTLPARLGSELRINPFLRSHQASIRHSVTRHAGLSESAQNDEVAVFAALRQWKNDFR